MALTETKAKVAHKRRRPWLEVFGKGVALSTPELRAMSTTEVPVRDARVKHKVVPCEYPNFRLCTLEVLWNFEGFLFFTANLVCMKVSLSGKK